MWAVVVAGALLTIVSAFFFDIGNARLQGLMLAMLAGVLGLLIFLIAFYDSPFRGRHGVTPEAYELVYDQLMGPEESPK
jgi:ABC-type branched-subunit amino acid transport system permease subunit